MDLSRQRSGRPGGPNPSPIQGAQVASAAGGPAARTRNRFKVRKVARTGQVAPRRRRYTRPWKLPPMSGGRIVAPQGPRSDQALKRYRAAGQDSRAGQQGFRPWHANTREGGRQRQRPDFRLTWGCEPTPSASTRARATARPKRLGPSFVNRGTLGHHGAPHLSGRWRPVPPIPRSSPGGANGAHNHEGTASPSHPRGRVTDRWASRPAQQPGP